MGTGKQEHTEAVNTCERLVEVMSMISYRHTAAEAGRKSISLGQHSGVLPMRQSLPSASTSMTNHLPGSPMKGVQVNWQ